jgi:hypothetical protein
MADNEKVETVEAQELLVKQLEGEEASLGCRRTLLSTILFFILIAVIYGAFHSDEESLQQSLLVELASGIGLFFIAPFFLRAMKSKQPVVRWIGIPLALACFIAAARTEGVTRLLFIEATGGLVILVVVETYLRSVLEDLSGKLKTAKEKRETLLGKIAAAKDPRTWEDELADYFNLPRPSMFPPPIMGTAPEETDET